MVTTKQSPRFEVVEGRHGPNRLTAAPAARLADEVQGRDPEFDRLRELLDQGRQVAEEFADEIERLRALFLHEGHGGDRKSDQVSQGVKLDRATGFVAKIQTELGLHPEQARRILDRVRYTRMLRAAAAGETVRYLTGSGSEKREETFRADAAARARARAVLHDVLAGEVKASAAWAGLVGESKRVAKTGKKERGAVDHGMNLSNAIAKLKTSLPHWREINPHDRAVIETQFQEIKHLLEGTLL